jgi:uroporphyrinogen-III decarboxylase
MRHTYPCATPEAVWALDVGSLSYDDLLTPVPHPCIAGDIHAREASLGEVGLYYPMLYTTLFMWAVEVLGWNTFMLAAALEPDRFHGHFLAPCAIKSAAIVAEMAQASDSPFVYVHDDLADARGPVFRPSWYEQYILPHYPAILSGAKRLGKKVIYVADGNMTSFLPALVEAGVDGLMFETPATPLDAVIEHFGEEGRFFIGGIATETLTFGTPGEVRRMVHDLVERAGAYPGFAMASGGGLHGNVPLENLIAYMDARAEAGATPPGWRTCCRARVE